MKNTLTTHISRILVVLLHFFNDVNVKTSSCYIYSMLSKHLLVTFFHSLLKEPQGPQLLTTRTPQFSTHKAQHGWALPCPQLGWGHVSSRGPLFTAWQSQQQQHTKIQTDFLAVSAEDRDAQSETRSAHTHTQSS